METYRTVDFAILADRKVKIKESEKRDKYLDLTRELRKLWNMRVRWRQLSFVCLEQSIKAWKGDRRVVNRKTSRDHPRHIIIKIGQNTGKSPGDLRTLAVIQTPVKDH